MNVLTNFQGNIRPLQYELKMKLTKEISLDHTKLARLSRESAESPEVADSPMTAIMVRNLGSCSVNRFLVCIKNAESMELILQVLPRTLSLSSQQEAIIATSLILHLPNALDYNSYQPCYG